MNTERRHRRSLDAQTALTYYFESLQERHGIDALALADERGALVAGAGAFRDLRSLAAAGRRAALGDVAAEEALAPGEDLYARSVDVGGSRFYVSALGSRVPRFREAAVAIARMLAV